MRPSSGAMNTTSGRTGGVRALFATTLAKAAGLSLPACLATPGWLEGRRCGRALRKAGPNRYFLEKLPIALTLCFRFWWVCTGTSEGLNGSLLVSPPHRKLDEEYKERIAALKNELRKEREQILQQVGKQRLELEQEIEKAKTEENYIRDRLALSLKVVILFVLCSVSCWGHHMENYSSGKRAAQHRAQSQDSRIFVLPGRDPDVTELLLGSRLQGCPGAWWARSVGQ